MKGENGFTVIELLVGMVIMAMVVLAASMSIGQMYKITKQNNDWSTATRQAQNAGYWLSHDAAMSVNITGDGDLTLGNGSFTMKWIEWDTGNTDLINYSLDGSRLKRIKTVMNGGNVIQTSESDVADHIQSIAWSPVAAGWQFTTQAVSRTKTANREYVVSPRVGPE